jgi:hypothetical protein
LVCRAIFLLFSSHCLVSKQKQKKIYLSEIPHNVTAEQLLQFIKTDPSLLNQFKDSDDKELYEALLTNDVNKVRFVLMARFFSGHKKQYEKKRELEAIEADPLNEENQRKIEEAIKQENIQQNMELAIENLPEAFGRFDTRNRSEKHFLTLLLIVVLPFFFT